MISGQLAYQGELHLWSESVRSKGGLAPYDAGLFFIVRERQGGGWPPRDIGQVSGWLVVRMLAHQFDKTPRDVARDVIATWQAVENGQLAP